MRLRRSTLALLFALSASCAVKGFSIDDRLPGAAAGNGGDGTTAGVGAGGNNSGGGNTGGVASGGKAQGGQSPQAGSANPGGSMADAGEPTVDLGGTGQGGEPAVGTAPCDLEPNGQPPLFCEDFEDPNGIVNNKWLNPPPGVSPQLMPGPDGSQTHAVELQFMSLQAVVGSFNLTAAGSMVTVSFWFKIEVGGNATQFLTFQDQSAQNQQLRLMADMRELFWLSALNGRAPSVPDVNGAMPMNTWICLSLYLSGAVMDLKYQGPGDNMPRRLLVDDMPTPGVDDGNWVNMPTDTRRVGGSPVWGGDPTQPGRFWFDNIRIARSGSVCDF